MTAIASPSAVTANDEQGLYVIPCGAGFTCLGYDVCLDRISRYAAELGEAAPAAVRGSLEAYELQCRLARRLCDRAAAGVRARCDLTPQLEGLEGARVEAVRLTGETVRFQVGRSTGPIPIHLEVARRGCHGGPGADRQYRSVRVVRPA